MIYVISDLHGIYDRYLKVIEQLQDKDELYVLGDSIDRGKDGVKILLDIKNRENVHLILGNHELLFLESVVPVVNGTISMEEITDTDDFDLWMYNGGYLTYKDMASKNIIFDMFKYIYEEVPLYKIIELNNEKIYLGHATVLENYEEFNGISLSDYLNAELPYKVVFDSVWNSPFKKPLHLERFNFDKYVFGHKYVQQFYTQEMLVRGNMYDIDGGCALGINENTSVILLCLDTMKVQYIR